MILDVFIKVGFDLTRVPLYLRQTSNHILGIVVDHSSTITTMKTTRNLSQKQVEDVMIYCSDRVFDEISTSSPAQINSLIDIDFSASHIIQFLIHSNHKLVRAFLHAPRKFDECLKIIVETCGVDSVSVRLLLGYSGAMVCTAFLENPKGLVEAIETVSKAQGFHKRDMIKILGYGNSALPPNLFRNQHPWSRPYRRPPKCRVSTRVS